MTGLYQHDLPRDIKLHLAKPNRKIIAPLKFAHNRDLKWNENSSNELTFSLPYEILSEHISAVYEPAEKIKEKFLIKASFTDYEEWFIIISYSKTSEESNEISVSCRSAESILEKKKLIDFHRKSFNLHMLLDDVLPGTGFTKGYINPNLNLRYREFDVTSSSKLSFLYEEVANTFEALITFDTVNMKVDCYEKNELSNYNGFIINEKRYLTDIEESIDSSEIVTRLHVTGSDGLGIQSVNPTGQRYIDDFSYFLYPFEVDEDYNVIRSSNYMEDDLALSLIRYNKYLSDKANDFKTLLEEKTKQQTDLSEKQYQLFELETELETVLDSISWMKKEGLSVSRQNSQRRRLNREISNEEARIESIQNRIDGLDTQIEILKKDIAIENHLSPSLLDELDKYIQEDEWNDNNKIDPSDLYESGIEKLKEVNAPPIAIQTSLVNFLTDTNSSDDWYRLHLSDIVRAKHSRLGIDIKARVSSIHINFDNHTIDLEITNKKELNTPVNKLKSMFYRINKADTDFNKRRIDYDRVANNFNLRNDRVKETPSVPTVGSSAMSHKNNDDGSVDITVKWDFPDFTKTEKKEHNIDGFMLYFYSDSTPDYYQFSTSMTNEQISNVPYSSRTFVYSSLPANLYYTIGIRAYRSVDPDVNRDGIIMSPIVRFNDNADNLSNSSFATAQSNNGTSKNVTSLTTFGSFLKNSDYEDEEDTETPINEEDYPEGFIPKEERDSPSYRPENAININGKLNGAKYLVQNMRPSNPSVGDIWVSIAESKVRVWDGLEWSGDKSISELDEKVMDLLKKSNGLSNKVDSIDMELDGQKTRINQIAQDIIRKADIEWVDERLIMHGSGIAQAISPPINPSEGKLWLNTSNVPNTLSRWNGFDWEKASPTKAGDIDAYTTEEIDEFLDSKINADTYLVDKDMFTKRFQENEASIYNNAHEISFKADQESLYALNDTVESHSTTLSLQAELIENKVDSTYVVEKIGEVENEVDYVRNHTLYLEQTTQRINSSLDGLLNLFRRYNSENPSFIGSLEAKSDNAYALVNDRLRITSKTGYNNGNITYRDLQANEGMFRSIKLNTDMSGSNFYLGVSTGELRVTSNLLGNGGTYRPIRIGEIILDGGGRLVHEDSNTFIQGNGSVRATRVRSNTLVPMYASAFNSSSSRDLKKNIQPYLGNALNVINDLQIVNFDWKDTPTEGRQIGVIAEDSPNIASDDNTVIKMNDLTMYNTKSIQELTCLNNSLRHRIYELEIEIDRIKNNLER